MLSNPNVKPKNGVAYKKRHVLDIIKYDIKSNPSIQAQTQKDLLDFVQLWISLKIIYFPHFICRKITTETLLICNVEN